MMKIICAFLAFALVLDAKVNLAGIAAGTTIGANLLTIKETIGRAKKAAAATKKVAVKAGRKLSGR